MDMLAVSACVAPFAFPATGRSGVVPWRRRRRRSFAPLAAAPSMGGSGSRGNYMFVLGTGFVGSYVARGLLEEGWQVSGTCRSSAKKEELERLGVESFIFNAEESGLRNLLSLQYATHLLISIPPVIGLGDPLFSVHEDFKTVLSDGCLQWLCYLSSTSVYGDYNGAWVDEDCPPNSLEESSKLRIEAEEAWLALAKKLGAVGTVFRLGGIYGHGRSALDTATKKGPMSRMQRARESRRFTSRVHVADIYQAIKASFNQTSPGRIYNVVDDDPTSRAEVFDYARALIERRWPGESTKVWPEDATNIQGQEFGGGGGGGKRVSNARMKGELGVQLMHPSFRSGLQSILDSWEHFPEQP